MRDARLGMQVAGDFAGRPGRLVTKHDRADRDFAGDHAAEIGRQRGIVIARNPDPVAPRLQRRDGVAVRRGQPVMGVAVVKTVAERDHHARIMPRDHGGEAAERRHRVIGRQQHAARGKARAFFQMQVGDDQQALLFPEQRAGEIGDQSDAGDIDGGRCAAADISSSRNCARAVTFYPVASLTSSSAASASNSSDASP